MLRRRGLVRRVQVFHTSQPGMTSESWLLLLAGRGALDMEVWCVERAMEVMVGGLVQGQEGPATPSPSSIHPRRLVPQPHWGPLIHPSWRQEGILLPFHQPP
ncbi:hypothetical protein DPEC_G00206890 [Dallia pectoralis]|uniref:Uncharacterized protein n=1 Tax=Dallia pectoralis TaxID=75939 RepID=A0ACC2G4W7_DALPE|nr:hypothetical protein DPEC_G00206890 [Dallia pectoralis]